MSKKINQIDPKIIDELIKTYEKPEDLLGEGGIELNASRNLSHLNTVSHIQ